MAILAFGTSPADFGTGFFHLFGQTAAEYLSSYAQEAVTLPNDYFIELANWGGLSEVWISFSMRNLTSGSDGDILYVYDENDEVIIRGSASGVNCVWEYWDGTAYQAITTFGDVAASAIRQDIRILIDASGQIDVYTGGTLQGSYTGDTTNGGARTGSNYFMGSSNNAGTTTMSGFFVADEETLKIEYIQSKPESAGTYLETDGGTFESLNGTGIDDRDFVYSNTTTDRATFNQGTITSDFGDFSQVVALGISARAYTTSSTVDGLKTYIRSGSTDDSGNLERMQDTPESIKQLYHVNPDTGFDWTVIDAASAEIGFQFDNSPNELVLLEGDSTDGNDAVQLEGDATDGNDHLIY